MGRCRCLRALREVDWPADALEVVMVDNASIDGLVPQVRKELPWVQVIENTFNAGFAVGCNLRDDRARSVDYVALLNNAVPERGWLAPLVGACEDDPTLGAASSTMVFFPRFVALEIEAPTFRRVGVTASSACAPRRTEL